MIDPWFLIGTLTLSSHPTALPYLIFLPVYLILSFQIPSSHPSNLTFSWFFFHWEHSSNERSTSLPHPCAHVCTHRLYLPSFTMDETPLYEDNSSTCAQVPIPFFLIKAVAPAILPFFYASLAPSPPQQQQQQRCWSHWESSLDSQTSLSQPTFLWSHSAQVLVHA